MWVCHGGSADTLAMALAMIWRAFSCQNLQGKARSLTGYLIMCGEITTELTWLTCVNKTPQNYHKPAEGEFCGEITTEICFVPITLRNDHFIVFFWILRPACGLFHHFFTFSDVEGNIQEVHTSGDTLYWLSILHRTLLSQLFHHHLGKHIVLEYWCPLRYTQQVKRVYPGHVGDDRW